MSNRIVILSDVHGNEIDAINEPLDEATERVQRFVNACLISGVGFSVKYTPGAEGAEPFKKGDRVQVKRRGVTFIATLIHVDQDSVIAHDERGGTHTWTHHDFSMDADSEAPLSIGQLLRDYRLMEKVVQTAPPKHWDADEEREGGLVADPDESLPSVEESDAIDAEVAQAGFRKEFADTLHALGETLKKEDEEPLKPGDYVEFLQNVERYQHAIAARGTTGVVVIVEPHMVCVELDDADSGLDAWQNQIVWTRDDILVPGPDYDEWAKHSVAYLLMNVKPSGEHTEDVYLRVIRSGEKPIGWIRRGVEMVVEEVTKDARAAIDLALDNDNLPDFGAKHEDESPDMVSDFKEGVGRATREYMWQWLAINTPCGYARERFSVPKTDAEIAEEALHAAFRHIQDALGETDGGFASTWLSGDDEDTIQNILCAYAKAQRAWLKKDDE